MFAYIIDGTPEELQSAIDITLQRFAEYQNLQGAFGRRAMIEQAKGILMARHSTTPTRRSRCCATTRSTTAASSPTSPRQSSRATSLLLPPSPERATVSEPGKAKPRLRKDRLVQGVSREPLKFNPRSKGDT